MGSAHQDLNLARLPFRHARAGRILADRPKTATPPGPARSRRRWAGGSPGTRTRNLRIKSPLLLPIELATRSRKISSRLAWVLGEHVDRSSRSAVPGRRFPVGRPP